MTMVQIPASIKIVDCAYRAAKHYHNSFEEGATQHTFDSLEAEWQSLLGQMSLVSQKTIDKAMALATNSPKAAVKDMLWMAIKNIENGG